MSKEPNINEEKIAMENAIRKAQRTLEDYIVSRLEALERIAQQQDTIIKSQEKEIEEYEKFIELLKKRVDKAERGYVVIRFYADEETEEVIKRLGLEKGKENE